jgi:hypothetical protein
MRSIGGRGLLTVVALAGGLLGGCATTPAKAPPVKFNHDPYPSTYRAYPGVPTLLKGATVLDGQGGRIDGGDVLIADGKVQAIGRGLSAPSGAVVVDATGKYVTPGHRTRASRGLGRA